MTDPIAPAAPAAAAADTTITPSLLDPSLDASGSGAGGKAPNAAADGAKPNASAQDPAASKPGDKKPDEKPTGAPEKYADFKLPEGVKLDPDVAAEFTATAKKLNLTQEAAQQLVDIQAKVAQKTVEQNLKTFSEVKKGWEEQTKKELGNNYTAERSMAAKGRDWLGDPELVQLLNDSGLGSHPAFFKAFAKLGKAIAEDGLVEGKPGSTTTEEKKSTAEVLFSATSPKK